MTVNIKNLVTEKQNEKSLHLDEMSIREIISLMNEEDNYTISTVKDELPNIEKMVEMCVETYNRGGRIIYIGAGSSGKLGALDAFEAIPTFSCDRFVGIVAGKNDFDDVEDYEENGIEDLKNINLNDKDMVIALAASGRTPYALGALKYARSVGALTGSIACNKNCEMSKLADCAVEVYAGPEILTGSTRLKAGTCQKMITNMISTATMVRVGKVYKNLMVDLHVTNAKLQERCRHIVMEATGCDHDLADRTLKETNDDCKTAILMIMLNISKEEAVNKLKENGGFIKK